MGNGYRSDIGHHHPRLSVTSVKLVILIVAYPLVVAQS